MPGKIKVKVLAGRNLPVMDRASDTTDAFVEIKFGGVTHKTDVCRKSLNPHWNSTEWYRFEVDESELQDEPLQLRLMDHDTYSANDAIGKVVISLAPLLAREANNANGTIGPPGGAVMSGWIPVFDTMHGTRGELNIIVKVELFSDFNKYKTSSCGVQFFHCPMIPPGYRATAIHGFVEELIVNDDPEYQWIDKIRTPRASNEARQVAFIKLSNQVQRLVGVKAAELGANAVVGYQQDFDLEGEAGVVARAIGTAVSITALPIPNLQTNIPCTQQQLKKYLDILATDEDSITDLSQYYQSHQEELLRIVNILNPKTCNLLDEPDIDDDEKSVELNLQKQSNQRSYTGELSLYNEYYARKSLKNLSEDQLNINRLLNRVNSTDSSGPLQTIKKIKDNLFSKKFIKKSRKHENDDQVSIKSSSSDTSRISFSDLKKEIKKIKKLKIPKLVKNDNIADEGVGMASILVRSVFHAHTSLARISESIDSEHSPSSTLRRTSESEPNVNTTEHDKISDTNIVLESQVKEIPEIHCSSLENIKTIDNVEPERKISESCPTTPIVIRTENFLKLPHEEGYYGSISSALSAESSEIYSSSEEDDESYSYKNDHDQAIETTSSLVKSVLSSEVDPQFIAQMEKKLTVLELANTELSNNALFKTVKEHEDKTTCEISKSIEQTIDVSDNLNVKENVASISSARNDKTFVPSKINNSHSFRIHNPFAHKKTQKSLSAPSSPIEKKSFMYRSSKRIKRHLSKISHSNMIKSLSHYSLLPKKKQVEPKTALSEPGSASDVTSKAPSDTVLGSPFLSYNDLMSLDKDGFYSLNRLHKSDEIVPNKVSMYIGSEPQSRASFSGPSSKHDNNFLEQRSFKRQKSILKPTGLIHTAMETILIDKVESLLIPTSPEPNTPENQKFFADVNEKLEKVEQAQSRQADNEINNSSEKKARKLVRQDSIHSTTDSESSKMSKSLQLPNPCKVIPSPVLQHFHPILSGVPLETIPSLPEDSVDRTESLDVDGVVESTNSVSVCCNSHAACGVDRSERERDRYADRCERDRGSPRHARHESYGGKDPASSVPVQNASINSSSTPMGIHRRSSDSDLSVTPKGSSLNASAGNTVTGGAILRPSMNSNNLDMLEYPFLTMTEYPPGFIVHIGGTVCARSVKLVDGGGESASRAAWWAELRTELRAHARALRCTAVLAYSERAAVREDVCVLSVSGTAAVINLDCDFTLDETTACPRDEEPECRSAHVPYAPGAGPYRAELALCGSCRRARVPSVLLATCAKPSRLTSYAKAITLTAVVSLILFSAARGRRSVGSEAGARDLSDQLPFLEYELHKLLLAKLRMQGANALFSLQTQIAIGERCVMALASGTAVRLTALPAPTSPRIKASEHDKNALEIQKALWDTFNMNKAANGYDVCLPGPELSAGTLEAEEDRGPALELSADKDTCVLELDEAEDVETAKALSIRRSHLPVYTNSLRSLSGAPPHAFMQVWRARLCGTAGGERLAAGALAGAAYKLRRLAPAALAPSVFHLDLPEDEIQLMVLGTAIQLVDPNKAEHTNGTDKNYADTEDDIFELDEEQLVKHEPADEKHNPTPSSQVSLTTLSSVQGSKVSRRVCSLRLLFVRETTAVRELGGLSGFLHSFTSEVLAIVRAYTAALGGNALTSLYLAHLLLHHHAHKNQAKIEVVDVLVDQLLDQLTDS
ncbi:unnamed protein product [Danaus chrysippus]|uniref:(African queen) hypothetical protein n=1 Tax=Danaus chrysippus TaxID=151541 RepID=A0A8J2QRW0_9NEOP|nr:unnamed protein product [Danaus chrysippus]